MTRRLRVHFTATLVVAALCVLLPAAAASSSESTSALTGNQARKVIEAHGFYGVKQLALNEAGLWRAQATKYNQLWEVEVDGRGNFTGAPIAPRGDFRSQEPKRPAAKIQMFLIIK